MKFLLNILAQDGQALIFTKNLIAQGVIFATDLSIIYITQFKLFLVVQFYYGL